jgi:secreted PhoX family phosphatase
MHLPAPLRRRQFLRLGLALAGSAIAAGSPWRRALATLPATGGPGPYGPLLDPDANGLRLPAGFTSRMIARGNQVVPGTSYTWHIFADGGACFPWKTDGWIYVSNSESPPFPVINSGGASAIAFDGSGQAVDAYKILSDTLLNCAGGATPWHTWLSCEEAPVGLVWECDPYGRRAGRALPAMGRFQHEAVAADPVEKRFYLTEDVSDGRFYRFTPDVWGPGFETGLLEAAQVDAGGAVTWHPIPEPDPADVDVNPTRLQVPESTAFDGGEGIAWHRGHVYFTTKGDGRVWDFDTQSQHVGILYDDDLDPARQLTGVDNLMVSKAGDILVAEDQTAVQQLVLITPDGVASPLLEMNQQGSELCGQAFDPSGRRMYVSSQRGPGPGGLGITYEISGPFRRWVSSGASCGA